MSAPDSLKSIKPYLERGAELKARDPIVSYHCRLYALQEAMRLRSSLPKGDMGFIIGIMDELEAEKATLGDLEDAAVQVENFGQELFLRADDSDRAGRSDLRTGKAFLAAAHVLECCKQFGELPADLAEKIKYAKVRFVEIAKATKEGRPPAPPPGAELLPPPALEDGAPSDRQSGGANWGRDGPVASGGDFIPPPPLGDGGPPSYLSLPEAPASPDTYAPTIGYAPPPAYAQPASVDGPRASALGGALGGLPVPPARQGTFKPSIAQMREAMGVCQSAVNALQFQDHETAVAQLAAAMQLLTAGSA